jgi:hypothetical protein
MLAVLFAVPVIVLFSAVTGAWLYRSGKLDRSPIPTFKGRQRVEIKKEADNNETPKPQRMRLST